MMIKRYFGGLVYAAFATLLVFGILFGWAIRTAHAALPPGFSDTLVTSVNAPTAFAFAPGGRLLITTQPGQLRVYQNGALLTAPALSLTNRICSNGDRGLLGVAVDPQFAQNRFIYLYYTFNKSGGGFAAIEFANELGSNSAVTMAFGPHGASQALYYTSYRNGGQIRRISR